ncbi:LmeA family phospholipid-binding protein [Streptomyces flaveolus]|uniref:LmeA family phospholipid-binding protein n=1 Tax=Streptomyces flaveolus TaxID=67297 RepID=UPI003403A639
MRALRILLVVVVILGGLFVIADRIAVNFAEDQAADKLRTTENLASTPDVSINGFPFLTQLAGGELDEVEVGIHDYEATTGDGAEKIRIDDLRADMRGVRFSGDFSSATAATATGTATIGYDELMKATKSEPTDIGPGITAKVVGLSDGGNGKIKVSLQATILGVELPEPVDVLSSVKVKDDDVEVVADGLPTIGGKQFAESRIRAITDFQQTIDELPGGIELDKVEAARNGVEITVKGSDVKLAG